MNNTKTMASTSDIKRETSMESVNSNLIYSLWQGGKAGGCVYEMKYTAKKGVEGKSKIYNVIFSKKLKEHNKTFSAVTYGSDEIAFNLAKNYQMSKSNELGLTKNMFRDVEDTETNKKWIEVQIEGTEGRLIMKCECYHISLIQERVWSGSKSRNNYVIASEASKKANLEYLLFYKKAYPHFNSIEHINKDSLDFRIDNVKHGKIGQSHRQSDIRGVFYVKLSNSWIAEYHDKNGKRKGKTFSVEKYGENEAKALAEETRKEYNEKLKNGTVDEFLNDSKETEKECDCPCMCQGVSTQEIECKCICKCEPEENLRKTRWTGGIESLNGRGKKNRYREVENTLTQEKWLEVELQNGHIMKCEISHLDIVKQRVWTSTKGGNTYYARSCPSKIRNNENDLLFHRAIYPQFIEVDHINRNGLDNRLCNLRDGGNFVNANNRRIPSNNTSGIVGVRYDKRDNCWYSVWNDHQGKKQMRSFCCDIYGEKEAKELAIKTRQENHNKKLKSIGILNENEFLSESESQGSNNQIIQYLDDNLDNNFIENLSSELTDNDNSDDNITDNTTTILTENLDDNTTEDITTTISTNILTENSDNNKTDNSTENLSENKSIVENKVEEILNENLNTVITSEAIQSLKDLKDKIKTEIIDEIKEKEKEKENQQNPKSSVSGVAYEKRESGDRWVVQYTDKEGKRQRKYFGIKKHGIDGGRQKAEEIKRQALNGKI